MSTLPVHPLLRQHVPADKVLYLCCEREGLARAWAMVHGVDSNGYRWLNPLGLSRFPKNKAKYVVVIGDFRKTLLDAIRAAGMKPISGEGFLY